MRGRPRLFALGLATLSIATSLATRRIAHGDIPISARGDRVTFAPARQSVRAGYERFRLAQRIPAQPYAHVHASDTLPGFVNTAPLLLDDGAIVVGLASPPGLAWVGADGHLRGSTRLDERPVGDLALGSDGRVFATSDRSSLYVAAPDATLRATITGTQFVPGAIGREDGTVAIIETLSGGQSITFLSPTGERLETTPMGTRIQGPTLGLDGCIWATTSTGVVCIDREGRRREPPFGRGALIVIPITASALAVVLPAEVQLRAPDGALRGRAAMASAVHWWVPLATGGVALLRANPTPELQILGPDATVVGRAPFTLGIGARILPVIFDDDGAFIAVTSEGLVIALEPDGTERWRFETRRRLSTTAVAGSAPRGPVPLPRGGFVVPLAEGGVLFVE